jgi:hypothetical protein
MFTTWPRTPRVSAHIRFASPHHPASISPPTKTLMRERLLRRPHPSLSSNAPAHRSAASALLGFAGGPSRRLLVVRGRRRSRSLPCPSDLAAASSPSSSSRATSSLTMWTTPPRAPCPTPRPTTSAAAGGGPSASTGSRAPRSMRQPRRGGAVREGWR